MRRSEKGLTLVELMIVVALLGILAGIAVPIYRDYITTAKVSEAKANLETIRLLEEQYYADNKEYLGGASTAALADPSTGLPGFQPGNIDKLHYNYFVTLANNNQEFVATAQPKSSSLGGNLTIDQDNNKTGDW